MITTKIKKGDHAVVISGKDRGKSGKVLAVFPARMRILVEGIGLRKKHQRPRRAGQKGEVITMPTSIHMSNALLYCSHCKKGVRTGYTTASKENKHRICKKCANAI